MAITEKLIAGQRVLVVDTIGDFKRALDLDCPIEAPPEVARVAEAVLLRSGIITPDEVPPKVMESSGRQPG